MIIPRLDMANVLPNQYNLISILIYVFQNQMLQHHCCDNSARTAIVVIENLNRIVYINFFKKHVLSFLSKLGGF